MIKEAYCSYDIAKLLKEKGFDWDCNAIYGRRGEFQRNTDKAFNNGGLHVTSAPTHQMACAWLREKYGYHISILWNCGDRTGKETFIWGINNINNFEDKGHNGIGSNVYEETLEAALKYTLENLI